MKKFFIFFWVLYTAASLSILIETVVYSLQLRAVFLRLSILVLGYIFLYAIPIGAWIYRDSRNTFGSTRDEAIDDAGFFSYPPVGAFPFVKQYFEKRDRFLGDENFRKDFLKEREVLRKPLEGSSRKKAIYLSLILIATVFSLLLVTIFYPNNPLANLITRYFSDY